MIAGLSGDPSRALSLSKRPELFRRPGAALPEQCTGQDDSSTERCEVDRQWSGHTSFDGAGLAQEAYRGSRLAALARSEEGCIREVQQRGLRNVAGCIDEPSPNDAQGGQRLADSADAP
jgi:hypothetical protein